MTSHLTDEQKDELRTRATRAVNVPQSPFRPALDIWDSYRHIAQPEAILSLLSEMRAMGEELVTVTAVAAQLRAALANCAGVICESGNLNNYRNLSNDELGKMWVAAATFAAETLNSTTAGAEFLHRHRSTVARAEAAESQLSTLTEELVDAEGELKCVSDELAGVRSLAIEGNIRLVETARELSTLTAQMEKVTGALTKMAVRPVAGWGMVRCALCAAEVVNGQHLDHDPGCALYPSSLPEAGKEIG